jgi:serine protease Do
VEVTPELAEEMGLNSLDGVIITHVIRNGAGEKGGLQRNDVITRIENLPITGKGSFEEVLSYYYPGDKITVQLRRGKESKTAQLTLQNLEGGTGVIRREFFTSTILGAQLETINTLEKDRFNISHGIKITALTRGYLRDLGLNNGFIITQINGEPAKNPEKTGQFLEKFSGRLRLEGFTANGQPFMQSYNVR